MAGARRADRLAPYAEGPATGMRTTRDSRCALSHRRDADSLVEAVWASLPELEPLAALASSPLRRSDALRFVRDSQAAWEEGRAHDFALRSHDDGVTHLGNISVWPTSRREQAGEVGYWVRSDRRNTESFRATGVRR